MSLFNVNALSSIMDVFAGNPILLVLIFAGLTSLLLVLLIVSIVLRKAKGVALGALFGALFKKKK